MAKKILVVDDEPEIRELITARLKANQYEVVTAKDGQDGVKKVKSQKPDLIITDIAMPNMDGYTFVREVKKLDAFKTVPMIVLTAKDKMQELFKIEGVTDYVVKPFSAEELLAKVKKYV